MIYLSADDYGLCPEVSGHIRECSDCGALNKISAFVNFDALTGDGFIKAGNPEFALHINLVEGVALSDPREIPLLADENGRFHHTFLGLLLLSLVKGKEFCKQVEKEISAQFERWQQVRPGKKLFLDSHQHTHMIPAIFRAVIKVFGDTDVGYLRIPAEPLLPYLQTPSLYHTYKIKNIIKQWLLKFLWLFNKNEYKKKNFPSAYFLGVLFSGEMDEERVKKILRNYTRLAEKKGKDIEILFHPGYVEKYIPEDRVTFGRFYLSGNRKAEYDSVKSLKI